LEANIVLLLWWRMILVHLFSTVRYGAVFEEMMARI
jgi:hypothetical protein